jgi:hypothetical protein
MLALPIHPAGGSLLLKKIENMKVIQEEALMANTTQI